MSLYDEENPLLVRPRPFWEEEPVEIAKPVVEPPPPVAPPAAPPPEVEGPGFASPEEIVAKAAPPPPEVVGPGFASPEEIPGGVKELFPEPPPPEVEGPGYTSPGEIAGLKPEPSPRQKLIDSISGLESEGYKVPHFIGRSDEPEGDRAPTMDMENLVAGLRQKESDASKAGDQAKATEAASQRAYWENEIKTKGMSAEQWRKQTGEAEPSLKPEELKPSMLGDIAGMAGRLQHAASFTGLMTGKTQEAATDLVSKGINAARSGWVSGDVAMELQKAHPSVPYVAQQQQLIDSLKPDENFNTVWDDKKSPEESFHAFAKDPVGNITQLFASSMGTMVRTMAPYAMKIPERTLQGAIGGAAIGAPLAGVGAAPGAATGARIGARLGIAEMTALSSKAAEYGGSVVSSLQEAGVDVRDKDQMERAFSDPKLMATIRNKAEKKGVPIALMDGLSTIIPGNIFSKPGKTVAAKAGQWGTEMLVQMGLAGGGEAGGQLWSEGKINSVRSILAEVGMEFVGGVPEVVTGRALTPETTPVAPVVPQAAPAVPPPIPPPPIPPTSPEAFAPPPAGQAPLITPPGAPPPAEVPGALPGEQPAYVNIGPGAPVVPGDERFAPPAVPPPIPPTIETGPRTPQGDAVTQVVGEQNMGVTQVAQAKAETLQASAAPKTAEAIQQVAKRSNTEATVSAADYLQQLQQQAADEAAEAAEKAATEAAKAAPEQPVAEAPGAVKPGEFAQPGYTAVPAAPAAAPAAQPVVAQPMAAPQPSPVTEPPAAVVVGGQTFTGTTSADAVRAAYAAVGPDAMASAQTGWVDSETGRFVSHEIFEAHRDLNQAIEESGGNMETPAVQEAGAWLAEAQARDEEINRQIVSPTGEQAVATGIKGQEALVSLRPSQELVVPLAGVNVTIEAVNAQGQPVTAQRSAAQALNDSRNDRTTYSILLDCLT